MLLLYVYEILFSVDTATMRLTYDILFLILETQSLKNNTHDLSSLSQLSKIEGVNRPTQLTARGEYSVIYTTEMCL